MKFNKKTLAKVLGEADRGYGPYTYVHLTGDEVHIGIELDGIYRSKSVNANDLLAKYKEWIFKNSTQVRTWNSVPGWVVEISVSRTKRFKRTGWFEPFGETDGDGNPIGINKMKYLAAEGVRPAHKHYYKTELEAVERAAWWLAKNQKKIERTQEEENRTERESEALETGA